MYVRFDDACTGDIIQSEIKQFKKDEELRLAEEEEEKAAASAQLAAGEEEDADGGGVAGRKSALADGGGEDDSDGDEEVEVQRTWRDVMGLKVASLGTGMAVGVDALLSSAKRSASIVTRGKTKLLSLSKEELEM